MAKQNKTQKKLKEEKTNLRDKFKSLDFIFPVYTIGIVFIIYCFSLFRPWMPFDEHLVYKETLFPIPQSFNEIPEIINLFINKYHVVSMNDFFSNIATLRSNPVALSLFVIISFLFQKHSFLYHFFQLFIHLANTLLVFIILKNILSIYFTEDLFNNNKKFILTSISVFTLIWALHSANIEAILLTTNWTALLTYTFCLLFLIYEIKSIDSKSRSKRFKNIILAFLFIVLLSFTEYGYFFLPVLFFMLFSLQLKLQPPLKALASSAKQCLPYFLALILFLVFSAINPESTINKALLLVHKNSFYPFIERNLWLSPQLFLHLIKLLLFPMILSLYQSNLVHISDQLITPYTIFTTSFYLSFLILPSFLFIIFRNRGFNFIFPLFYAFYFSALPILHVVSPTYCLSADRYCYFPGIFGVFIIAVLYFYFSKDVKRSKLFISVFISLVLLLSIRTLIRINEWNNPYKLYESAVNVENNPLYKGQRLNVLANYAGFSTDATTNLENNLQKSLYHLEKALKEFEKKRLTLKSQPATLKIYGLDYNSLTLKAAYFIAVIKNDNYREPVEEILNFYEPYIKRNLKNSAIGPLGFYTELLVKAGRFEEAENTLRLGLRKCSFSDDLLNQLADLYLNHNKDYEKAFKILEQAYNIFPNDRGILHKLLQYYEAKEDSFNEARISYLIGLREHSIRGYQRAVKIYLDLNQITLSKEVLKKLVKLKNDDPFTLLLTSRYLDLTGNKSKILEVLNSALIASNNLGNRQDTNVTKSILISLINTHINLGNLDYAKKLITAFEGIKELSGEDQYQLKIVKARIDNFKKASNN